MSWTNGAGIVISDDTKGWTAAANQYVYRRKKWGNGGKHSGPSGRQARGYHVIMRALAEVGNAMRKRQRTEKMVVREKK